MEHTQGHALMRFQVAAIAGTTRNHIENGQTFWLWKGHRFTNQEMRQIRNLRELYQMEMQAGTHAGTHGGRHP